ncbi:ABC transporter permease [Clostridium lundense]|uniref:ABC transporter permease n=1 Tax=Clostridium lundense TaxID=319475 RepID=UPI00048066C2|nr:ABC transporter permease [Clostridium lundense]
MFLLTLKSEQMKLHKSPIWIPFFAIPCISAFMGTFNYLANKDILTKEWYSLWTQHTIFYCYFFLPVLIGIYCAYLCRLENINNNWNSILTSPVSIKSIYFSKFITVMKMLLFTQIFEGILFYISGKFAGFTTKIPSEMFLWLLLGFCAGAAIVSVQLTISLVIKSFSVPIGISLLGGFLGVAATAKGVGLYFPYSLFSIGMCANNPSAAAGYSISAFVISCVLFVIIFSKLGIIALEPNNNW